MKVVGGSVTLPFLTQPRTETIQGDPGTQLEGYLAETITVPQATLRDGESGGLRAAALRRPRGTESARRGRPARAGRPPSWPGASGGR